MPKRIQRRRTKGWRMPENTVSVTRPGRFGNPFKVVPGTNKLFDVVYGSKNGLQPLVAFNLSKEEATELAVRKFREGLSQLSIDYIRQELKGKDLACFCKPGDLCHADVLLEVANK